MYLLLMWKLSAMLERVWVCRKPFFTTRMILLVTLESWVYSTWSTGSTSPAALGRELWRSLDSTRSTKARSSSARTGLSRKSWAVACMERRISAGSSTSDIMQNAV